MNNKISLFAYTVQFNTDIYLSIADLFYFDQQQQPCRLDFAWIPLPTHHVDVD